MERKQTVADRIAELLLPTHQRPLSVQTSSDEIFINWWKKFFLSTISKFRYCFQMQRLLFVCQDVYFQKWALIWRAFFPPIHLAAPEEEDYTIISGAHDLTQECCSNLWSWTSQQYNSKSVLAVARTANWLTKSLLLSEVNSSLDPSSCIDEKDVVDTRLENRHLKLGVLISMNTHHS